MTRKRLLSLGLVVTLLLAGCAFGGTEDLPPTPTENILPTAEPTATTAPTPTPTPDVAILLTGEGADSAKAAEVESALNTAAAAAGLQVTRLAALDAANVPQGLRLVVAVPPISGLAELAAALPQVQFVAVGFSNLAPAANLTVVSGSDADTALAFTAGYVAAVQSEEYRVGIITTNDTSGQLYRRAFLNGAIYFCGTCTPYYPPYEVYPMFVELPPGASANELEAAAEVMFSRGVTVAHVIPSLQTDAIYQYIAQRGVFLVGTAAPPAGLEANWAASVIPVSQMSLGDILQAVLESGAVGQVGAGLKIDYTGASEARVRYFEEIIQNLESGLIDPVGAVD